jgi:acetyltransferase-like isoleucine patch superfamily enzyme
VKAGRLRAATKGARRNLRQRLVDALEHAADDEFYKWIADGVLTMGRHSYGRPHVRRFAGDTSVVRIGAFVSIAEEVEFIPGGSHRTDWISTYPIRYMFDMPGRLADGHPASKGDIVVGNDVWIATGAKILSGVRIGDGAVVGAGAVVSTDVRPYAVVAGNPATEVYRRFSDAQVKRLESIAWWDWPIDAILDSVGLLCSADVDAFIRRADEAEERPPGGAG